MPALQILGRRWHLATDDFVLLPALGAIFHIIYASVIGAAIDRLIDPLDCEDGRTKLGFMSALLIWDVLLAALMVSLAYASSRGSILEYHKRRAVPVLASVLAACMLPLTGLSAWGAALTENAEAVEDNTRVCGSGDGYSIAAFIKIIVALHVRQLWVLYP